ncbi:hypothetical protein A2V61_02465 [Candidatus Woesebacteria bacterium RBG_19FT_COMBO_47_8]|uniref:Fibronectin type-III domain-containing protein n=1 Tax=Candidatus Woesebacteria bacterium RBG_13_46_13 TaxID=1802479 RepID=A0A1F7X4N1_9BACT|nr:MAG: hypothetical protein A2Y68_00745 [Candidatus Woesebacteria bacterium RBG_13_46_13]OGM17177.1 MAG: hypothetical protein A2V61_02465 [Candidatus Woesebacteria bacterium RBG_19FT_COMBO_47_8]HJX59443.1 Ig-like domain-containing protein [Patescibacteria group bacterium]
MRKILLIAFLFLAFFFAFSKWTAAYNSPDFHSSSIVATMSGSDRVPADGKTEAVLTVTVKDAYGTPLAGEEVSVVVTDDPSAIVAPESNKLDSSGKAVFYIKSTKEGVDSLDIVDKTQNVALPGIGHVTFYSTTCTDAAPGGPPKLVSATPISNSQIKLTWTKATDPVTFYTVYYGTKKGTYIFGNPNVGGANTTSYTVGSLGTGVIYYFIVIPGNGCTLGPISNELSAKAALAVNSPTPTQKPVITSSPTPTVSEKITREVTITPPTPSSPFKSAAIIASAGILLLASIAFLVRSRR